MDFTNPASQSILRPGRFESFEVYFIEAVEKASFEVSDDMGMCLLEEGEEYCNPEDPVQGVDPSTVFGNASWSCYNSNVCRPGDPEYDPAMADKLSLEVSASVLEPGRYMVKLRKDGDTPIISKDGYHLKDNVDVYIRMVSDDAPTERPYVEYSTIDEFGGIYGWYPPHAPLALLFSQNMGFINFIVDKPCLGFNFEYGAIMLLQSDSIQGMAPGKVYSIDVISDDVAPNGVPWTMDAFGNTMESTYSESFKTGHVRILFPIHDPFSLEPDDWGVQLEVSGYEEHAVFVEITEHVDKLMFDGGGHRADISFADRIPTAEELYDEQGNRKKSAVIRIDIDPDGIPVCDPDNEMEILHRQLLEVHATKSVNGGSSYRGWDRLYVDPFPPDYEVGFPEGYTFRGDYPKNWQGGYTNEIQGVAHDASNWFFSKNDPPRLLKVPVQHDLKSHFYNEDPDAGIFVINLSETPLSDEGYNHFGDIDYHDGHVLVPVYKQGDESVPTVVAVFASPQGRDFEYIGSAELTEQRSAGWLAVNPVDGYLYSSDSELSTSAPLRRYSIEIDSENNQVFTEYVGSTLIQSGETVFLPGGYSQVNGQTIFVEWLDHMQGGAFSKRGHLYLVNGYYRAFERSEGGIWVFSLDEDVATVVAHSNQEYEEGTFKFKFAPGSVSGQEPEGLTIWDIEGIEAPGGDGGVLVGQIHVMMIDNYHPGYEDDQLYFKHYTVTAGEKCKI
ncbi:MAG: hypothetical protein JRF33_22715 [Deltaproteobacteria bacterium]|nr:hypothetical protein [Deltaproteobacteria bacterium]